MDYLPYPRKIPIQNCFWHEIMSPTEREGGHIDFGAAPVGVGHSVGVGVTLPSLHDVS